MSPLFTARCQPGHLFEVTPADPKRSLKPRITGRKCVAPSGSRRMPRGVSEWHEPSARLISSACGPDLVPGRASTQGRSLRRRRRQPCRGGIASGFACGAPVALSLRNPPSSPIACVSGESLVRKPPLAAFGGGWLVRMLLYVSFDGARACFRTTAVLNRCGRQCVSGWWSWF